MKIHMASAFVDDRAKALDFHTDVLRFIVRHDVPLGEHRRLTVMSREAPDGMERLLEPNAHPAVEPAPSLTFKVVSRR